MTMIPFKGKGKTINNPTLWTTEETYYIIRGQYIINVIPKGTSVKQFETINKGWTLWRSSDNKHWHIISK
jgi:hypothetical protein